MDEVFKALADPTRRGLLDELHREDGQSLSALEARVPMSRFGVMKHLRVLEEAGLVVTKRRGREKLHFLNPVPIRLIHDRWVSRYTEPWAATLTGLKRAIEEQTMEKVFEIYIKTTPERLWEAIIDPELRSRYTFGVAPESDWTPGSEYKAAHRASGTTIMRGREPGGRPAAPARAELQRAVERGRARRGHLARHVGDRTRRRLVPAAGDPRRAAARAPTARSTAAGRRSSRG